MLARCEQIARGEPNIVLDDGEANVMRVASMLARSRYPLAARRLGDVAAEHFARRPEARRETAELVRSGRLSGLPRFRALLEERLRAA